MPQTNVTKLFDFAGDLQGWFLESLGILTWSQWEGKPYGSALWQAVAPPGGGYSGTTRAIWQGTWEDLGVPPGKVVVKVKFNNGYVRGLGSTANWLGAYVGTGRDLTRVQQQKISFTDHTSNGDIDWVPVSGVGSDWYVPAQFSASNQQIWFSQNMSVTLTTPNTSSWYYLDQLSYTVTYDDQPITTPSTYTGIAKLTSNKTLFTQQSYYYVPSGIENVGETHPKYKDCITVVPETILCHVGQSSIIKDTARGILDLRQKRGAILFADLTQIDPLSVSNIDFIIRRVIGQTIHPRAYSQRVSLLQPYNYNLLTGAYMGQSSISINTFGQPMRYSVGDLIAIEPDITSNNTGLEINRILSFNGNIANLQYPLRYNHIAGTFMHNKGISLRPVRIPGGALYEIIFNYPSANRSTNDKVMVKCMAQTYEGDMTV